MSVTFHADDYGITEQQAADILKLSQVCGGQGALSSVSIFANSPAFEAAAEMARPYVESGKLAMALHLNLVEGRPCAPVAEVPLLVNQRGTFANDFVGLLKLSMGAQRWAFRQQLQRECVAQIQRYLTAFPQMKRTMRVDSHQHTHAVPAVFDALSRAGGMRELAELREELAAGGYLIQLLPGAGEDVIAKVEGSLMAAGPVTGLLRNDPDPEAMLRHALSDFDLEILERSPIEYRCYCSRDRMERALISLGPEELQAMIDEQGSADLTCRFCDNVQHFSKADLEAMVRGLQKKM